MEAFVPITTHHNSGKIQVVANISINAKIARRLVNVQLMRKVGQMIITGEPEIAVDGESIYWKVPLFVSPPDDDENIYPLKTAVFVDAISGIYVMEAGFVEQLRAESTPILRQLYPELEVWN
jgi:hypothetical protein